MRYAHFVIETDHPTAQPLTLDTDRLTIDELYQTLRPELEAFDGTLGDDSGLDYFSVASEIQYDNPRRHQVIGKTRWFACYAVTGTSEGHYIHIDRIYQAEPYDRKWTHEPIFLAKTFGGYSGACALAAYLGARLGA